LRTVDRPRTDKAGSPAAGHQASTAQPIRAIILRNRMSAIADTFELRLKGAEGIARVFFCTLVGQRIVMLHSFIKKSDKTPPRERRMAESRMKEVRDANP